MSNRDYYGDNVPENLATDTKERQFNSTEHSESNPTAQEPWSHSAPNNEHAKHESLEWREHDPSYNPQEAPEGERGLAATVVGGAGGAVVGHHFGKKSDHGTLGAVGGAVAGAALANIAESVVKGNRHGHGSSARDRRRERLERRLDRLG
ncbi:hypothetical protein FQN54_006483 [Arachnomyces sp. PD_36]|nr:hypothetical protein FQN54_006483 [Arachnomyces sp. PD_36]